MKKLSGQTIVGLFLAALAGVVAASAGAQNAEVKEKAPLYTYVSNWDIPRTRWADMAKDKAGTAKILDRELANGTIVAFGSNESVVHSPKGPTHGTWWCAMSMAGVLNPLDEFSRNGLTVNPVLASATGHWDSILVSRFYDWRPGTVKSGYVHGSVYKLKADASNDAVEVISKSLIVPLFEKLMAEGTVQAYQIAEEGIHSMDPGQFFVYYLTPKAEGLDKVNAALSAAIRADSLAAPAFSSMVDFSQHRDELSQNDSTFK